ncbi:MAG: type II toxin-antitoxin system PemK/MazF family toxin [Flavobacteriales bacterium]
MKQGEIWMANFDPTKGSEQAGFRPILIFSGDLFNTHTPLVIGLPLSSKIKNYKGNIILEPSPENGLKMKSEIFTFHIRSIAKERLIEKIGRIEAQKLKELRKALQEILTY